MSPLPPTCPRWYVLYTRPKWELKTFQALTDLGIETYCPTFSALRQWSDRRKKVRKPYFNNYIFVRLSERERNTVFAAPGVMRYLFWQGRPAVVRDSEVQLMREYLDGERLTDIRLERLSVGDTVTFTRGALKERSGVIEEINNDRVRLVLPLLGYRISARVADLMQ